MSRFVLVFVVRGMGLNIPCWNAYHPLSLVLFVEVSMLKELPIVQYVVANDKSARLFLRDQNAILVQNMRYLCLVFTTEFFGGDVPIELFQCYAQSSTSPPIWSTIRSFIPFCDQAKRNY